MPSRRTLLLGTVQMRGGRAAFSPAPDPVEAAVGEELLLTVAYDYEESSRRHEEARLLVTTELDGVRRDATEVRIGDRPLVRDTGRGAVAHVARFPWRGDVPLRLVVEAQWLERPWLGGGERLERFRDESNVVVKVR